jgi:hypothetical protein
MSDVSSNEETATDYVRTASTTNMSEGLSEGLCDAFLRRRDATLVALVAGPEAGKTTLISTMYELARRAALKKIGFAGSETILGFEIRCHLSRQASGLDRADTERTKVRPPQFLHLRLAHNGSLADILLCDRSGESFDKAIETPGVVTNYVELERAHHVLLLVDGSVLNKEPHKAAHVTRRLFRALLESGVLTDRHLHLVVTKSDLFDSSSFATVLRNAEMMAEEIRKKVPVTLHMTAARRGTDTGEGGDGIEQLMDALLRRESAIPIYQMTNPGQSTGSTFERLMNRYEADHG